MAPKIFEKDMHIPVIFLDNPIRRWLDNPRKYCEKVHQGEVVADLGCGPGFFTIALAEKVGTSGRIYAVDSDIKPVRQVEKKARKRNLGNIETHHTSASNLSFIPSESVDFVLADGLLCTMASRDQMAAVLEILRIMKKDSTAFIVTGRGSSSHMDDLEWELVISNFCVLERNRQPYKGDRWAYVAKPVAPSVE